LFAWAVRKGWLVRSPAAALDLPRPRERAPSIHTPGEVAAVLRAALALDPAVARLLAIRYFAGIRTSEGDRLNEEDILAGHINIPAQKAKTRRRRVIPISPNLAAWLALPGGELPPLNVRARIKEAVGSSGVSWPGNVTRHSFCSYHLAEHQSAAKTALAAGHSEAAAQYWRIVPPGLA
jgi:integrase